MNEAQVAAVDIPSPVQSEDVVQTDSYTQQAQSMLPTQDFDESTPLKKAITDYGRTTVTVQSRLAQETMQLNTSVDLFTSQMKVRRDSLLGDLSTTAELEQRRDEVKSQQDKIWDEIQTLRIDAVRENLARIAAGVGRYIPIRQIRERSISLGDRMRRLQDLKREHARLDVWIPMSEELYDMPRVSEIEQDITQVEEQVEAKHADVTHTKAEIGVLSEDEEEGLASSYKLIEQKAEDALYVHHDERQKHFDEALIELVQSDQSLQAEIARLVEAGALDESIVIDAQKIAAEILADFDSVELSTNLKRTFEERYKEKLSTFLVTQGLERFDMVTTQDGKPLSFQEQRLRSILALRIIGIATQHSLLDQSVSDRHLIAALDTLDDRLHVGSRHYLDRSESVQIAFELIQAVQDPFKREELIQAQLRKFMPDFFDSDSIPSNDSMQYFTLIPSAIRNLICEKNKANKFIGSWFKEQAIRRKKRLGPRIGKAIRSPIMEKSPIGFSASKVHPYSYFDVDSDYYVLTTSLYDRLVREGKGLRSGAQDTFGDTERKIIYSAQELGEAQKDIWFSEEDVRVQLESESRIREIVKEYCDKLGIEPVGEGVQTITVDSSVLQRLFPGFPVYNMNAYRDMHLFITAIRNNDYLEGSGYILEASPDSNLEHWSQLLNAYSRQVMIPSHDLEVEYPGGFQFIPPQEDGTSIEEQAAKIGQFYDFSHPMPQPRMDLLKGFHEFSSEDFGLKCFYEITHGLPIDKSILRDLPQSAREAYHAIHRGLILSKTIPLEEDTQGYLNMHGIDLDVNPDTQGLRLKLNKLGFREIVEGNQAKLLSLQKGGVDISLGDYDLSEEEHFIYQTYMEMGLEVRTLKALIGNNNWSFVVGSDGRITSPEFDDFYVLYSQIAEAYPRQFGDYLSSENAKILFALYQQHPASALRETISLMQESDLTITNVDSFRNIVSKLATTDPEKRESFLRIIQGITTSPVSDISMLADELIDQILETDNPEQAFRRIEAVFIRNNIPHIGKVFVIFRTLYPEARLDANLKNGALSPALRESSGTERYRIVFNDLMRVSVDSSSRSMMTYLRGLQDADHLIKRFEEDASSLGDEDLQQLEYFCRRAETLYDYSLLGQQEQRFQDIDKLTLKEKIELIKEAFKVQPNQTFADRVVRMYLGPLGFRTVEDVSTYTEEHRTLADRRNRSQLVSDGSGNYRINLRTGSLVKAAPSEVVGKVLDNGILAREYLGIKSGVDATPFDSDFSLITADPDAPFEDKWNKTIASNDGCGDILFIINPERGRISDIPQELVGKDGRSRYELIHSNRDDHRGIRTGLGSTEIDGIICKKELGPKRLEEIYIGIAQKGIYIPVANKEGEVIFTPEMFEAYRRIFDGIAEIGNSGIRISPVSSDGPFRALIDAIKPLKERDVQEQQGTTSKITRHVASALEPLGIGVQSKFEIGLLGARIMDTGSTGRHTNKPGDGPDYDFVVRLNARDIDSVKNIVDNITSWLSFRESRLEQVHDSGARQLRLFGVEGLSDEPIDIDVGFQTFNHEAVLESHDVNERRLMSIREQHGDDAYIEVLSNIALAKKLLTEGGAYKKPDGGFGGIGVENWILQHEGNIEHAFQAFWDAAHDSNGEVVSYEQFQRNYRILDPGINLRFGQHDNYARVLKSDGYTKMLSVIERFMGQIRL